MSKTEDWADQGLKSVIAELSHCAFPLTLELASQFIRTAYNEGYQAALTEPGPVIVLDVIHRRDELALRIPVS